MNFLYKESMCNGTNKGSESGRLRSRAERKRERRSGKESKGHKGGGKRNARMTTVFQVLLSEAQSRVMRALGIVLPKQDA